MQIYEFIGISKQSIIGIKNPILTIEGTCTKKDIVFSVVADGDEILFQLYETPEENGFGIKAPLSTDMKYIKVYAIDGSRRLLIFSSKMSVFNRIGLKVEIMVGNIYNFLKVLFPNIGKGISYAWKKYHLLVPFKLWSEYFNKFKKKVKEDYDDIKDNDD